MKHRGYILLSGFQWLLMGLFLLYKGLHFLSTSSLSRQTATQYLAIGLLLGFLKGRFVLVKTVRRVVSHIAQLSLPIHFKDVYKPSYWLLIGTMMALGLSFRFMPVPIAVRGVIDVAIGSALINSALLFFRASRTIYDTGSRAQSP